MLLQMSHSHSSTSGFATALLGGAMLLAAIALDATQAEQAIFASSQNELWFTLLPDGQGPSSTDGVDYGQHYLFGSNP